MVWPLAALTFGVLSKESIGHGYGGASSGIGSNTWPVANVALFVPFRIATPIVVRQLWLLNGSAVSGNFDIGIYDEKGTRLLHTGSTPQAGTSTTQFVDVDDTLIGPGVFYFGLVFDNTTATVQTLTLPAVFAQMLGLAQQASAFALPANATFASYAQSVEPVCGLTGSDIA